VTDPSEAERNRAAALAEFQIWDSGDLSGIEELVSEDIVHHDPYDPHAADGLEGLKRSIAANHEAFPDLSIEVKDQVAEGDRVATRWLATMTHHGPDGSKRVELPGITIERFAGGKAVESWRSMDMLGLMRQMGALPDDRPPSGDWQNDQDR
jgi:predicted ester cyclase